MKRCAIIILGAVLLLGCGSSSDNFKDYKDIRVLKDGSISLIEELKNENDMPARYHKVYFNNDGTVKKEDYIISGNVKISSEYHYDENGKISEIRHFEDAKYNGVSKYIYKNGIIDTEDMYDRDLNFVFSKKID